MGSYKELEGDLLDMFDNGDFDAIVHGANCRSVMGAGIAGQIANRYPKAFEADRFFPLSGKERLGCFSVTGIVNKSNIKLVINLYSQYDPGPNADLDAIKIGLRKINLKYKDSVSSIGLPLIGCGIGGLEWEDVKPVIQKELSNFDITVVHFKK